MNLQYPTVFFILMMLLISVTCNSHLRGHIEQSQTKNCSSSSNLITGFLCIIGAAALLWFNERRQAVTLYRIEKANRSCTSVDSAKVNPNTNHQLIHINGLSTTRDFVFDPIFEISLQNCIKLERKVEMYQWVRKQSKKNRGSLFYYVQEWSSVFHYECKDEYSNDQSKWIIQTETQINLNVWIGDYLMSKSLAEQTNANEGYYFSMTNAIAAANHFNSQRINAFSNYEPNGNYIYFQQKSDTVTLNDLRVSFCYSKTGPTSIVSQQLNNSFTPYIIYDKFESIEGSLDIDNIECSCRPSCCFCCAVEKPLTEINWIYETIFTQNYLFKTIAQQHVYYTNLQRVGGYVLMGIGFCLIFSPISWLISWFPLIGNFLATITGFVFFLVSFIISIPFSILTIAFAWLFYHPKFGIALILLSGAIGTGIYFYLKSQS